MGIVARTQPLLDALKLAAGVIRTHQLTPDSWMARLAGDGPDWSLTATNFETTIDVFTRPDLDRSWAVALPVRPLLDIANLAETDTIRFDDAGHQRMVVARQKTMGGGDEDIMEPRDSIKISAGDATYWMQKTAAGKSFDKLKPHTIRNSVEGTAGDMRDALAAVLPLIPRADDTSSYNLKAVCLDYDPKQKRVCWVAGWTKFFGVAASKPYAGPWDGQVLVPVKAAKLFAQALAQAHDDAPVTLAWVPHEILLRVGCRDGEPGTQVVTKAQDGRFMPWHRILELKYEEPLEVTWGDFVAAHKRASLAGDDIRIRLKPAGLMLDVEGQTVDPQGRAKTRGRAKTQAMLLKPAKIKNPRVWCFGEDTLSWVRQINRDKEETVLWYGAADLPNRVVFADGLTLFVSPIAEAE